MKFFSGFSLDNENYLFDRYIKKNSYNVCGFSYGAIKAFEYVKKQLLQENRVDTLQLFSPAFFQTKDLKFKRLQLLSYKKNEISYIDNFINSCFSPYDKKIIEHKSTNIDELEELLTYEWDMQELKYLAEKGVEIEVYLGAKDIIIDVDNARNFFLNVATITYIKDANHFLQTN